MIIGILFLALLVIFIVKDPRPYVHYQPQPRTQPLQFQNAHLTANTRPFSQSQKSLRPNCNDPISLKAPVCFI